MWCHLEDAILLNILVCFQGSLRNKLLRTWASIKQILRAVVVVVGFSESSVGKESACNAGDSGSIPGSGRSPGEGIGYPLENSRASLVAQLVKNPPAMLGDLGSIPGLGRSPWRRERPPTSVFWSGEFQGPHSPRGCKEWDMTEWVSLSGSPPPTVPTSLDLHSANELYYKDWSKSER